jgi:hypothetical protein
MNTITCERGDRVQVVSENAVHAETLASELASRPVLTVERQMPDGDYMVSDGRIVPAHHLYLFERAPADKPAAAKW